MLHCAETAAILAENLAGKAEVIYRDELLPGGSLDALLAWTVKQSREHEQIAWVGHCPDVNRHTAASLGGGEDDGGGIRFGKGAIAAIRFEGPPQRASRRVALASDGEGVGVLRGS